MEAVKGSWVEQDQNVAQGGPTIFNCAQYLNMME